MILIDTQKEEFNKLKHVRIFSKVENENRFNGNLLVIGLGGVGGKVVTALKRMMMGNITREDNINYLLLDSDIPGYGLNALEVLSIYRPNLGDILTRGFNSMPVQESLAKWMSPDFPRVTIGTSGAEGNRQIGRLMFSNAYEDIRILLFEKLEELYNRSEGGKLDIIIVRYLIIAAKAFLFRIKNALGFLCTMMQPRSYQRKTLPQFVIILSYLQNSFLSRTPRSRTGNWIKFVRMWKISIHMKISAWTLEDGGIAFWQWERKLFPHMTS